MFTDLFHLKDIVSKQDLEAADKLITDKKKQRSTKKDINSYLMLSSHNVKHLSKIDTLDADAIILNLEDGVSEVLKPIALKLAILAIQNIRSDKKIIVRINALDEGGKKEIEELNKVMPDAIRVPKIKDTQDVKKVDSLLHPSIELHLSIETKEAFSNIAALKLNKRVTTFYLGMLDLFADLDIAQSKLTLNNSTIDHICAKFLIESKCCGAIPVGFTFQEHKDLENFKKWCAKERLMGYSAKSCISPKQVEIVNTLFKTDSAQLERAKNIIKLFEENKVKGITGFDSKEYGFIDEPIYKDALNIVKKGADDV